MLERGAHNVATLKVNFDFQCVGMHRHNSTGGTFRRARTSAFLAAGEIDVLYGREIQIVLRHAAGDCHLVSDVGSARFCFHHGHGG